MDIVGITNSNMASVQNATTQNTITQENVSNLSSQTTLALTQTQSDTKKNTNLSSISKGDIKNLVQKLNDTIKQLNDSVKFSYSEDIKGLIVKVIDNKTGQVIRQIPPEELIKLEASLAQSIGLIFNKEVK